MICYPDSNNICITFPMCKWSFNLIEKNIGLGEYDLCRDSFTLAIYTFKCLCKYFSYFEYSQLIIFIGNCFEFLNAEVQHRFNIFPVEQRINIGFSQSPLEGRFQLLGRPVFFLQAITFSRFSLEFNSYHFF